MPVASLVLGIVAIVFGLWNPLGAIFSAETLWSNGFARFISMPGLFGVIFGVVAIVLAVKGKKALKAEGKPTGKCTAGLVLGIIATALCGIVFVSCGICASAVVGATNDAISALDTGSLEDATKALEDLQKASDALKALQ